MSEFIRDMIPLLHTTPAQAEPIKYVFSEMIRNVLEHSESGLGAVVCAQYFRKTNRVALGIADYGIGIKRSMERIWGTTTHSEAITLALMPGVSGKTKNRGGTAQNAGAGLFFTKSIARVTGDYFMVYSGDTLYKLQKMPYNPQLSLFPELENERYTMKSNMPFWDGTCIGIDFSLSLNREFVELIDKIRDAYFYKIEEKQKQSFKKPRFE